MPINEIPSLILKELVHPCVILYLKRNSRVSFTHVEVQLEDTCMK